MQAIRPPLRRRLFSFAARRGLARRGPYLPAALPTIRQPPAAGHGTAAGEHLCRPPLAGTCGSLPADPFPHLPLPPSLQTLGSDAPLTGYLADGDITIALELLYITQKGMSTHLIDVTTHEGIVMLTGLPDNLLARERAENTARALVAMNL